MKHNYLKGICGLLMMALVIVSLPKTVMADAEVKEEDTSYDRYIAFGEDLSKSEKQKDHGFVWYYKIRFKKFIKRLRSQTKKNMNILVIILHLP